jgi:D-alanyl-D-alanine carboxypeptidase/D-alanyl-D-alanine-endopeptidase (penicillin-binding protein 4)
MVKKIVFVVSLSLLVGSCSTPEADFPQSADIPEKSAEIAPPVKTKPRPLTANPNQPDPVAQPQVEQYVERLAAQGFAGEKQGIWLQTDDTLLATNQGTTPLPAASITKIATTLATLTTFDPDHRFVTEIGTTGQVENGVVKGDLVIQGDQDSFFVWESAIALGNLLNEIGIKEVTGDLIIVPPFYMNFEANPETAGTLFKEGINASTWSSIARTQHNSLTPGTPQPQVVIQGEVQVVDNPPRRVKPLISHQSLPVAELLKKMNQYSNNKMAEMLANAVGGADIVAQKAAKAAGVPQTEIQLINGSGLGEENRISPRAAVAMFRAINQILQPHNLTVGDVVTVTGQDEGVLSARGIPSLTVAKSGTLNNVSALAGALPTTDQGTVWFAIINYGSGNLEGFHNSQEALLQQLSRDWGAVASLPKELNPSAERKGKTAKSIVSQ